MCMPDPPEAPKPVLTPPAEPPKPLATPEGGAMTVSQLRLGSKNNLKMRAEAPASGLTLGSGKTS